jgi:YfiH family protein
VSAPPARSDPSGLRRVSLGDGVAAGFTDRRLGPPRPPYDGNLATRVGDDPAAVADHRRRLLDVLGATELVLADQVHGTIVVTAPAAAPGAREVGTGDALVSDRRGVVLAVLVADCLPVLIVDDRAGVIGAAHAGRRGLVAGVLTATVQAMEQLGAHHDRMTAHIGPGICSACYEVPYPLREQVAAELPGSWAQTRQATPSLDLPAAAAGQLQAAGLRRVTGTPECTAETPELFSYRRDGTTGRFAGWITLS